MDGTPCGANGHCVPGASFTYTCDCKPDFEEEMGVCVPDDDIGLKIALPIVLILLLLLFIFVLLKKLGGGGGGAGGAGGAAGVEMGTTNAGSE